MTGRKLISLAMAAEMLDVSPRMIRNMIADGKLPGYRVGKRLLKVEQSEVWAMARRIPSARMEER